MKPPYCLLPRLMFIGALLLLSCDRSDEKEQDLTDQAPSEQEMVSVMQQHLDAVTNRDLQALKRTMSPEGTMQLILPGSEIMYSVDEFMDYHREWFKDSTWTFDTRILNTAVGDPIGMAVVEVTYREPDRAGKPYYNRMIVSYDLKRVDRQWYVIKDHASSVERSSSEE